MKPRDFISSQVLLKARGGEVGGAKTFRVKSRIWC